MRERERESESLPKLSRKVKGKLTDFMAIRKRFTCTPNPI